jgi:UDP-N-acetylglucosamine 2-epimerase (hydrolysing)
MKQKNQSRNLLFVTGTRADYGKLEPLASAAVDQGHKVTFFVTGMHMLSQYGLTKEEVHLQSKYIVQEYVNQRIGDSQDVILAKTITGFSDYLLEYNHDLVIFHGDRIEALACGLVCAINYIRCAHVEGGEVSGTIDEQFRHCNSKLANIHFVSSKDAAERILKLGESKNTIHLIGSPELDVHKNPSGVKIEEVFKRYEIKDPDYGICIFHPVTSELNNIYEQANALFSALVDSNKYFVVILPNNDPGAEKILQIINKLPSEKFRVIPSMRFNYFSELIKNSKGIIGNSSMGVREAPFLGVPSLNIGTRQFNRSIATSMLNSSAFDGCNFDLFFKNYWGKKFETSKDFGTGEASKNFIKIIEEGEIFDLPFQKYFSQE